MSIPLPIPMPPFADSLELLEIFAYYDRPVLFTCTDAKQTLYLAVLSAENEDENTEAWIFTPIVSDVLDSARAGDIDLRTAFKRGIQNRAYVVTVNWNDKTSSARDVKASMLEASWLPDVGVRLN